MSTDPGYCRTCLTPLPPETRSTCPACGSKRLLRHAEINALSIAHIDCDAFYAAIEKRDDPSLADKPVIIGGRQRGVVATACYVARLYGVRSAMPMFQALKRCPDAVVLQPRGSVYAAEGRRIREMMEAATPLVEPLSIDEAFLDLTGTQRLHGHPPALTLLELQRHIFTETGLTVSVGLSYNKFLAKTASDLDKPDGFALIGEAEAGDFLKDRPVGSVFGVGPAFAARLQRDGIRKLADVLRHGDKAMAQRYGEAGLRLSRLARGEDHRRVSPDRERKSISSETTFNRDIADRAGLESRLWSLCEKTAAQAKVKAVSGTVVTLKLKTAKFKSITRRRTLRAPTQLADTLYRVGCELLAPEANGTAYRLIGIGLSGLEDAAPDAGDLLDPNALKRAAAERAMDRAREKFGGKAVIKGRSLRRDP
ncbi:DNA polymerase IV [Hyphobacterium marinum]|uniref:DNA polymerase IV n=1 Tax=Hyphobacterium marinum TaxID=3116574 RepID=A0ABU7LZ57_9PROT|nr:DNA polymerase IV [Hyphobacterium sp. Y6023]MEE2566829.1 DNA polymerase IV [Hyphobacterium sp. Y6023]